MNYRMRSSCWAARRAAFSVVGVMLFGVMLLLGSASQIHAGVVLSGGIVLAEQGPLGSIVPDNLALASNGAAPFALDELSGFGHFTSALNNGLYGNGNSWIGGGATGTSGPFAGINLGASPVSLESIAFGRSNVVTGDPCAGGVCPDRSGGLYTLQYTTAASPNELTPDALWTTIGTLDYQSAGGVSFSQPWRRHRYNFPAVSATGVRLMVPATGLGAGTAIDEIELYANPGAIAPPTPSVVLNPQAGYVLGYDGNEGLYVGAVAPGAVPANLALGAAAVGSTELGPPSHTIGHINDGSYGNAFSWISNFTIPDPNPWVGVNFPQLAAVTSIAFGRSNVASGDPCGVCTDRSLGTYTLQITTLPGGGNNLTPETDGEPENGWDTVGSITLQLGDVPISPWKRHEFSTLTAGLGAIEATGLRLKVSDPNIAIDELEVYGTAVPEPSTIALAAFGLAGLLVIARRRR